MVRMSEGHLQCGHTIRFSELTKNLQFGAKTIMQNLSVPFIFQGECRMKIEHVLFPSVFKIKVVRNKKSKFFSHRYLIEFYERNRMSHVPHLYNVVNLLK